MTWKLTDFGQGRLPLSNVPWRDLTDAEFALACARYPELEERGYFAKEEPVKDQKKAEPAKAEPAKAKE